jgi:hypothetical protein
MMHTGIVWWILTLYDSFLVADAASILAHGMPSRKFPKS